MQAPAAVLGMQRQAWTCMLSMMLCLTDMHQAQHESFFLRPSAQLMSNVLAPTAPKPTNAAAGMQLRRSLSSAGHICKLRQDNT